MRKSCLTCSYFQISEAPPKMRGCAYKGKIWMNGSFCGCWKNYLSFKDRVLVALGFKQPYRKSLVI